MVKEKKEKEKSKVEKFDAVFTRGHVFSDKNKEAVSLYNKSRFGEYVENKVQYSLVEALLLIDKKRLRIKDTKNKVVKKNDFIKKCEKLDKNFFVRYKVFNDLRKRGYIVKTALKFGADFRVYDKGIKPGEDHAKWIVYPLRENEKMTLYEFSAKNRVAHSTRKTLLLAIVDDEGDVSYWNSSWIKP